jgi:hypothetical protein
VTLAEVVHMDQILDAVHPQLMDVHLNQQLLLQQ